MTRLLREFVHTEQGSGCVQHCDDRYTLHLPQNATNGYHNAQISSYARREDIRLTAPLRLSLRAHVEGELCGTAGFGFWNHPFSPMGRGFRIPRAVWFFFGGAANNMALAQGVPGQGFKAATFDALRPLFFALLPAAPLGFLLMRQPNLYRHLWPIGQRALGVDEKPLDPALLRTPREYTLEWGRDAARFFVDGQVVFSTKRTPRGALGFVAWVDNQFAVVTPQGRFGWGLVPVTQAQALILEDIRIESQ